MNLFVALVMGLCMVAAAVGNFPDIVPAGTQWPVRLCAILACVLAAPMLAAFQTWSVAVKLRTLDDRAVQNRIFKRIAFFHALVWAVAMLTVFTVLKWPTLVADTFGLKPLVGVYELTLLIPLLLSMTLSWFVFHDIQAAAHMPEAAWALRLPKRLAYVEVRLRMILMTIVGPLFLLMIAIRYSQWMEQLSTAQTVAAASVISLAVMCVFPWLVTRFWKTGQIEDQQLDQKLMAICKQANIGVRQIKIWKTGFQMANAAVTGLLPGTRVILLSDLLLKQFEPEEVEAIVRHEAGHVRLKHLPLKMMFIVVPMLVLMIDRASQTGITSRLAEMLSASGGTLTGEHAAHVMAIGFAFYLLVVLRWLSHKMEFEADLFAATDLSTAGSDLCVDQTRAALWRLAVLSPDQFRKRTMMHPSIKDRIMFIEKIADDPALADVYRRAFSRRKWIVMMLWGIVLLMPLLVVG